MEAPEPGTSLEIALRTEEGQPLVDPFDGVMVDTIDVARRWLDGWKEMKSQGESFRRAVERVVIRTMDAQAKWTLPAGPNGFRLTSVSPKSAGTLTWDLEELAKLKTADPPLPKERYDEMVTVTVSYKVSAAEANRIAAAHPAWAAIIEEAKGRRLTDRRVEVRGPGS